MMTWAAALIVLIGGFLWGAVQCWRQGQRKTSAGLFAMTCAAVLGLTATVLVLRGTDNFWLWAGIPMACRFTLKGC
jgi:hypothetical protein